uniref:Uncharacterized protein n=1 Tax=Anguilla anguilla TaxID=7936 RepID=A0A0E9QUD8_ANGAN
MTIVPPSQKKKESFLFRQLRGGDMFFQERYCS